MDKVASDHGLPTPDRDLWVVRHGQSTANVAFEQALRLGLTDHAIPGPDADIPLSPLGARQAAAVGRWLSRLPRRDQPDVIYCSPYLRARRTLEIALDYCPVDSPLQATTVVVDDRLRDRQMGAHELLTPAAIEHRFPDEAARRRREGDMDYSPPGGESLRDVKQRIGDFLQTVATTPERRVLVIGHDATMLMVRAVAGGLDDQDLLDVMRRDPVRNAAVGHWQHRGGWELVSYNDTSHLVDLDESANPTVGTP